MKKLLCLVPVVMLFAVIGTPNARADSYDATFTCSSCFATPEIPSGVTFPTPTTFTITYGPITFSDFILSAPDAPTDTYEWSTAGFQCCASNDNPPINSQEFYITDETDGVTSTGTWEGTQLGNGNGSLTFSPASAATPEPAPVFLMLLGVGLMFLMRKRFVFCAPRTV